MKALAGKIVGLSISDAPDRAKLGFPDREIDCALFSICTVLIRAGARISYAGDLRPPAIPSSSSVTSPELVRCKVRNRSSTWCRSPC